MPKVHPFQEESFMTTRPLAPLRRKTILTAPTRGGDPFPKPDADGFFHIRAKKYKPVKLKRFRPKRRLKGNEDIEQQIKDKIDIMSEYSPAYSMVGSMRQALTGQSCLPKRMLSKIIETPQIIFDVQTNYGNIVVQSQERTAETNPIVYEALEVMGVDESTIITESFNKYSLGVITEGLKQNDDVIRKTQELLEVLQEYLNEFEMDEEGLSKENIELIKYITPRKNFMKTIYDDSRKYVHAYSEMKKLFEKESTTGTFPRNYRYNGVVMYWNNISESYKLTQVVPQYFKNYDIKHKTSKHEEYRQHLRDISKKYKKTSLRYTLDGFDYLAS